MQRICNKILNMTTFIYIPLLCPKHYGALKWGVLCKNTAVITTWWNLTMRTLNTYIFLFLQISNCGVQKQINTWWVFVPNIMEGTVFMILTHFSKNVRLEPYNSKLSLCSYVCFRISYPALHTESSSTPPTLPTPQEPSCTLTSTRRDGSGEGWGTPNLDPGWQPSAICLHGSIKVKLKCLNFTASWNTCLIKLNRLRTSYFVVQSQRCPVNNKV